MSKIIRLKIEYFQFSLYYFGDAYSLILQFICTVAGRFLNQVTRFQVFIPVLCEKNAYCVHGQTSDDGMKEVSARVLSREDLNEATFDRNSYLEFLIFCRILLTF